jgi:hypothetical protein
MRSFWRELFSSEDGRVVASTPSFRLSICGASDSTAAGVKVAGLGLADVDGSSAKVGAIKSVAVTR